MPVIEVLSAVSIGLVVWYGGIQVATGGTVTFGDLTAILIFINMLFRPLRQLADRFNTLQMGMVASERVLKLLDRDEIPENDGEMKPQDIKGEIEFKDVWFAYKDEDWVLKGVDIKVEKGETLAIVGATGAGKTTIINLINRLYDIQKGTITVDGVNIVDYDLSALRKNIAIVLQDVFLYSNTVRHNITLGKPIAQAELEAAAELIGVNEILEEFPNDWSFEVGERGGTLSSGQRQMLAFLRAYVSNPSILILDEATSSVDTHTEQMIQRAIDQLTEGRTSIIIAHRLATVQKADRILVMDKGRVIEQGNHDQLLRKGGAYTRLYEMQFKLEEEPM
jgi:ATP-binding cassette subfamily B protein